MIMNFCCSRYSVTLWATWGRALSWWNFRFAVPDCFLCLLRLLTRGLRQSSIYDSASTLWPLSKYVICSTPLVLKKILTIVLGSKRPRRTTVRGLSPSWIQLELACLRPICLQKNHDSSPVTTSHKRQRLSRNRSRLNSQTRTRSRLFCSDKKWGTQRDVTFFRFKESWMIPWIVPRQREVSASTSS